MASSISNLKSPPIHLRPRNPLSLLTLSTLSITSSHRFPNCGLKTRSTGSGIRSSGEDGYSSSADLLRKPVFAPTEDSEEGSEVKDGERGGEEVTWEDKILEDTVPLVGFIRMILHSGKYESGERLDPQHEKTILERLLPYHPECESKIGCGIDYITELNLVSLFMMDYAPHHIQPQVIPRQIGYHPDFPNSRCLFIVRKDGELVDFSYWKCIKGFVRKHYPLHANSFILRHFRWRRHIDWR